MLLHKGAAFHLMKVRYIMGKRGNGEGSIYKQKDGLWAACITVDVAGKRKRKYFYGKTRKEVKEKLTAALHEKQQGMLVIAPNQTVEEFLTYWLSVHKLNIRSRSYERYEGFVRLHVVPVIGRIQLQKLTAQHIQLLYTRKLEEKQSPTTVNTLHMMLHRALKDAVRWGLVARNVCDLISPPRRAHYEIKPLTLQQAQQLLAALHGHNMEALFVLALTTGMRRGEILALKWQDINFAQSTLQVRRIFTRAPGNRYVEAEPKTEKSRRSVMLPLLVTDLLKQHHIHQLEVKQQASEFWQERDLVFCTSLGTPLNPNKVLERFKTVLKKAELPDIRFHDLRHSAATMLLGMKVHPKIVQELLGHNQISMTMDIYSHVLPTMQEEAMNMINEALQE
jgi:integrase